MGYYNFLYLFVPSLDEIPEEEREKHDKEWFALGDFYETKEKAMKAVRDAGYEGEKIETLKKQGYLTSVKSKSREKTEKVS